MSSNSNAITEADEIKNSNGDYNDTNNNDDISLTNELSMPTSTASEPDDETELDVNSGLDTKEYAAVDGNSPSTS
eukprot:14785159-Ditylum_brightwellii.AAC.1